MIFSTPSMQQQEGKGVTPSSSNTTRLTKRWYYFWITARHTATREKGNVQATTLAQDAVHLESIKKIRLGGGRRTHNQAANTHRLNLGKKAHPSQIFGRYITHQHIKGESQVPFNFISFFFFFFFWFLILYKPFK